MLTLVRQSQTDGGQTEDRPMLSRMGMRHGLAIAAFLLTGSVALAADDGVSSVSKSSGEVWVTTAGAAQVSLKQEEELKPGDTIRTGRNGRVLRARRGIHPDLAEFRDRRAG